MSNHIVKNQCQKIIKNINFTLEKKDVKEL